MDLDAIILKGLLFFVMVVTVVFFFQRFRWRWRRRLGKRHLGFYPSSASMGNALQELQILAQPQVEYVLEEKLDEEAEDDDAGGPEGPTAQLHRQTAKIRRGEKIDHLRVMLPMM